MGDLTDEKTCGWRYSSKPKVCSRWGE